ncbi:uncharacterized protein [Rutidosis leptorrhynchoides]|uniref:uncharacterized protein n=1 Tax=Rutidosis leptorrhynchoides TaxID=125765 RepID=UPI003A9A0F33
MGIDISHRDDHLRSYPLSLAAGRARGSSRGNMLLNPIKIRVESWNVGSLTSKSLELVNTPLKSKVDILCVQVTRWRGQEAVVIEDYKLWYAGFSIARNGVGIIIGPPYKDYVVGEKKKKRRFWVSLDEVVRSCLADHRLLIGGDLNGHIGIEDESSTSYFPQGGHSTHIDYLLIRKGDLRACGDCRVLTTWTCSTQHRLLVMDLVLQRRVTRSARPVQPRIPWKNLNGEKAETFKASVLERVEAGVEFVTHGDADQMWNSVAFTFRDVSKEVLGVAVGTSEGTLKDRTRVEERYKEAKREAKKAVACAKDKAYEDLYKKLDSKEGANDIYRISKARERRRRDIDNIKFIKDEAGQTIVNEDEIRKRWERYFSYLCIGGGPGCQEDPRD